MKKIYLIITLLLSFSLPFTGLAQDCSLRVSLLTVSPGEELYSTFGHTALRISDSTGTRDIVFNYGTFNFDEPGFYIKFARGKLNYYVSAESFANFEYVAMMENRSITEQTLNLTCTEKEKLLAYLDWNMLPANKYYKYDFTFDNCTTRVADLIDSIAGGSLVYKDITKEPMTFRDAIHDYLNQNEKPWSKLGIDLLLGRRLDRVMTIREELFLPEYLMNALDSVTTNNQPLVSDKATIFQAEFRGHDKHSVTGPLFIFTCLFVLIGFLSFSANKIIRSFLFGFDGVLFFIIGVLGIVLVLMWVATDHYMTKDNYNLLWAWPTHAVAAFYVHSRKRWVRLYYLFYAIAQLILIALWFWLPQQLNPVLIPLNALLIFRCFILFVLNKSSNASDTLPK
ncbi:MAG TPA: DUF4105 domain-containing protein [Ginsengibacter sp.]|nr:DUF4105 domain-containing protein [Chitinophagaceae bacterium]HRP44593.1 DUF4105 domain-containing protein [Ginsengibacter sp.]